jgi:asparagine synthase (glutamine-hydrolysing)
MGCLFGYCGHPAEGLLDRMAGILNHRCINGWERASLTLSDDHVVEIGHGIPPWSWESHVGKIPERHLAFGYSGVFFNRNETSFPPDSTSFVSEGGPETRNQGPHTKIFITNLLGVLGDDPERLSTLEGSFVAALAHEGDLALIRDPSGIKVIYWTRCQDRLVFASEIKALFADPSVPRKMRIGALPEYLTFSFVPGERTMFENIYELQPGTTLKYHRGDVFVSRHFAFENREEEQNDRPDHEYAERVRADLERSVRECCAVNDGTPAVFLSGGIDSSAVLAVTAREFPDVPIKTFSVHFGSKYVNENEYVSMVVDRYETEHTWLEIRPSRFMKQMRRIIWCLDDPIGDPITVPNFLLAKAGARVSKVVLNGEGGDPCFGGPKNIPMLLARLYGPLPGESSKAWMERNYLLSYRKCFNDLSQILSPAVIEESGGEEALTSIITPFLQSDLPRSFINKLMTINICLKGANLILVKVDKMTSANGLLALPPLFSKRIVETSMACPPTLKLVGNVEKGVLKRAVEDIVPLPIIQRPKCGMMVPVRFWFRSEMRRYAKKVLSQKNLNRVGFFNTPYVRKLLDYDKTEIQGSRHGLKLWMFITFMLWYEQMIESSMD